MNKSGEALSSHLYKARMGHQLTDWLTHRLLL